MRARESKMNPYTPPPEKKRAGKLLSVTHVEDVCVHYGVIKLADKGKHGEGGRELHDHH